jgi:apolipoprotein N-acyltransferase
MGLLVLPLAGAGYCLTGALLTRWIGFSPFVLGVAWMGVELSLAPLGLDLGIVKLTDSSAPLVHWLAHTLGYVLVAFAVAFVNAQLAIVLSKVRLTVPQSVRIVRRAAVEPRLVAQQSAPFFLFDAVPCHPRAPPLRNCQLTRTVMCV